MRWRDRHKRGNLQRIPWGRTSSIRQEKGQLVSILKFWIWTVYQFRLQLFTITSKTQLVQEDHHLVLLGNIINTSCLTDPYHREKVIDVWATSPELYVSFTGKHLFEANIWNTETVVKMTSVQTWAKTFSSPMYTSKIVYAVSALVYSQFLLWEQAVFSFFHEGWLL